jgi:hypothetical protein
MQEAIWASNFFFAPYDNFRMNTTLTGVFAGYVI